MHGLTLGYMTLGYIFRDASQGQLALFSAIFAAGGSGERSSKRPDWKTDFAQSQSCIFRASSEGSLLRRREKTLSCLFDQQPRNPGIDGGASLSEPMADRTVLSLDKRTSEDQALLWNQCQCSEDPDLDFGRGLSHCRDSAQTAEFARHIAQNISTFERSSI